MEIRFCIFYTMHFNEGIVADTVEAIITAIFIDRRHPMKKTTKSIRKIFSHESDGGKNHLIIGSVKQFENGFSRGLIFKIVGCKKL